jgi:hypothetical protein
LQNLSRIQGVSAVSAWLPGQTRSIQWTTTVPDRLPVALRAYSSRDWSVNLVMPYAIDEVVSAGDGHVTPASRELFKGEVSVPVQFRE